MKLKHAIIPVFLLCAPLTAQDLGSFEEVTAGNFYGIGARQMAMGGAGIASSLDGAALFYNPAALARIHRIEFQFGLTHQQFENRTDQLPGRYTGFNSTLNSGYIDLTKTRLGTINLSLPVPTYRGSLVVAFGFNRYSSFDRAALFNVIDASGGLEVREYAKEFETGSINLYSVGAGMDISPRVSLGLALNVYSGDDNFTFNYQYLDETNNLAITTDRLITEDYIGASFKGGLLMRPNSHLTLGLSIETPLDYQVEYFYEDDFTFDSAGSVYLDYDAGSLEYDLTRPFIFGGGLAARIGTLTLTGDAEYIDWSQLSYNDNRFMSADNDSLSRLYREVVNLRAGAEFQIPRWGLSFRGGVFSNPLPYRKEFIDDDRFGFSLGLGWLVDRALLLETAYVNGSFKRHYSAPNDGFVLPGKGTAFAEDKFQRVYFTLSYRY